MKKATSSVNGFMHLVARLVAFCTAFRGHGIPSLSGYKRVWPLCCETSIKQWLEFTHKVFQQWLADVRRGRESAF